MSDSSLAARFELAAVTDQTADGAIVHDAVERHSGRLLTVTVLDAERYEMARRAGVAQHRHLLPVHGVGTDGGAAFLVSERREPDSRQEVPSQARVADVSYVRSVVRQLAAALDALAAHGYVHLGVDPATVRLEAAIHPADPGTVRLGRLHGLHVAGIDVADATPLVEAPYVAPELSDHPTAVGGVEEAELAPPRLTPAADRWALGAVAFTLLTGQAPFPETAAMTSDELDKVRAAKAAGEVPPIARVRPPQHRSVPPAVDQVLRRVMAADPSDRPASAAEFAEEFARACDAPLDVRPTEPLSSETRPRARRRLLLGAAPALVLVGLVAWLVSRRGDAVTDDAGGLPRPYRFVQRPLAEGCARPERPGAVTGDALDVLRCTDSGLAAEVVFVRYRSIESRDQAAARLLDQQVGDLAACSVPPLLPDPDRPAALACFETAGGARLLWAIDGRPVLGTVSSVDGSTGDLEIWLREVSPSLIEAAR